MSRNRSSNDFCGRTFKFCFGKEQNQLLKEEEVRNTIILHDPSVYNSNIRIRLQIIF